MFAALNTAVFAADFDVPTLIVIYAMLILGGAGSIGGVILGAFVVNVSLEVLRTPDHATWVFYLLILSALVARLRPWRWLVAVIVGTVAFGYLVHAIVAATWDRGTQGTPAVGGILGSWLEGWMVLPSQPQTIGNVAFVVLVLAVLALTLLHGVWQKLALIPTLYLTSFVWENRLVVEPSTVKSHLKNLYGKLGVVDRAAAVAEGMRRGLLR